MSLNCFGHNVHFATLWIIFIEPNDDAIMKKDSV